MILIHLPELAFQLLYLESRPQNPSPPDTQHLADVSSSCSLTGPRVASPRVQRVQHRSWVYQKHRRDFNSQLLNTILGHISGVITCSFRQELFSKRNVNKEKIDILVRGRKDGIKCKVNLGPSVWRLCAPKDRIQHIKHYNLSYHQTSRMLSCRARRKGARSQIHYPSAPLTRFKAVAIKE